MLRYLAFAWDARNEESHYTERLLQSRLEKSPETWKTIFEAPGLKVLRPDADASRSAPLRLQDNAGVILGSLFETNRDSSGEPSRASTHIDHSTTQAIVSSGGRHLIGAYWGSYILFLCGRDASRERFVLRSPMSSVPCFCTTFQSVKIFFSRMEDCLLLGAPKLSINWPYIAAQIGFSSPRSGRTAITEVSELAPGECALLNSKNPSTELYWDPSRIAQTRIEEAPETAARLISATAQSCVQTWAALHERVVLLLSGGFDSSVVLGCFKHAKSRPHLICLNDYSSGSDSDERSFARAAAADVGCELIERERTPSLQQADLTGLARTAVLYRFFMALATRRPPLELARARGATVVLTGNGGDELFYRTPVLPVAADFIKAHGMRARLFPLLFNLAQMERVSLWKVWGQAMRIAMSGPPSPPWKGPTEAHAQRTKHTLVNREVANAMMQGMDFTHPWLRSAQGVPPAKQYQIFGLATKSVDDPLERPDDPQTLSPLLSQPLVEACLRIPTYMHIGSGVERGLARKAFAGLVPREILERTTKGHIMEYTKAVVLRNLDVARELLLDGTLVRERLLRRDLLEPLLSDNAVHSRLGYPDLVGYLSTELWLRSWADQRVRAAA